MTLGSNVAESLALHARSRSDRPAIVEGDRVIRYGELDAMVSQRATQLYARGVAAGDVVGVALRDSAEHLLMLFALARAGIVLLPLDWRWTPAEQAQVARHFDAKLVIVEPDVPPISGLRCLAADAGWLESVERTVPDGAFPTGDGPLLLSLSSGTTGRPKGPRLQHTQFLARFRVMWVNLGFTSEDRYLSATPLYFGGGRTFAMLMLYSGATVHLFPAPYEPAALAAEIARRDTTAIFLVPTLLRRLLELDDATLAPFRSLRLLLSSGAALHVDERRAIRARMTPRLIEYYSSTEGGGVSYLTGADAVLHEASVGRPVFGVDVECVDEAHRPLPPGEVGRIRYRGPAVASGFWNDAEASADAFRDGWYYPGDLGTCDADGFLYLKGRAKDMIIRGGINIYPGDVEAALQAHPSVVEAAVVGWASREFNEEVAAFVITNRKVDPAELRAFCRERLAPYKVPREVFVVTELPRNTLGKIVKTALRDRLPMLE